MHVQIFRSGLFLCSLLASCAGSHPRNEDEGAAARRALQRACQQARLEGDQPRLRRNTPLVVPPEGASFRLDSFVQHSSPNPLLSDLRFFVDQAPPGFTAQVRGSAVTLVPRAGAATLGGPLTMEARDRCGVTTPFSLQVKAGEPLVAGNAAALGDQIFDGLSLSPKPLANRTEPEQAAVREPAVLPQESEVMTH